MTHSAINANTQNGNSLPNQNLSLLLPLTQSDSKHKLSWTHRLLMLWKRLLPGARGNEKHGTNRCGSSEIWSKLGGNSSSIPSSRTISRICACVLPIPRIGNAFWLPRWLLWKWSEQTRQWYDGRHPLSAISKVTTISQRSSICFTLQTTFGNWHRMPCTR